MLVLPVEGTGAVPLLRNGYGLVNASVHVWATVFMMDGVDSAAGVITGRRVSDSRSGVTMRQLARLRYLAC